MSAAYTTNFYTSMYRNLSVLRDIHRIIMEARALNRRVVTFRDENGKVSHPKAAIGFFSRY